MRLRALLLANVSLAGVLAVAVPAQAQTVEVTISNFRYCVADACTPLDQAYLRADSGPVVEAVNPLAPIAVTAGQTVRFTYADTACDAIDGCPGHDVRWENGTPDGSEQLGYAERMSSDSFELTIPEDAAGRTLLFFCDVSNHWRFGMTAAFAVAGTEPS